MPAVPSVDVPDERCLSVLIPVYNEVSTIRQVVPAVLAQAEVREVLLIDDGSTDGSSGALEELAGSDARVRLYRHACNRGKGAAVRTGLAHALGRFVLIHDADLEYDPDAIPRLLAPLRAGTADAVFGTRFGDPARMSWHRLANALLTRLSNLLNGQALSDMETGSKAFRRELFDRLVLEEDRFGFEPEIVAKLSRLRHVRIAEVPVGYRPRTRAQGKKLRWYDGADALRCILRYALRGPAPMRAPRDAAAAVQGTADGASRP